MCFIWFLAFIYFFFQASPCLYTIIFSTLFNTAILELIPLKDINYHMFLYALVSFVMRRYIIQLLILQRVTPYIYLYIPYNNLIFHHISRIKTIQLLKFQVLSISFFCRNYSHIKFHSFITLSTAMAPIKAILALPSFLIYNHLLRLNLFNEYFFQIQKLLVFSQYNS